MSNIEPEKNTVVANPTQDEKNDSTAAEPETKDEAVHVPSDDTEMEDALASELSSDESGTATADASSTVVSTCPECAKKSVKRERGLPFGRKPGETPAKKPKSEPKTAWGKWQRDFIANNPQMRPEVASQIARISYTPTHSDGRAAPKSYERLLRETYSHLDPSWKKIENETEASKKVRDWLEKLLVDTILAAEAARSAVLVKH